MEERKENKQVEEFKLTINVPFKTKKELEDAFNVLQSELDFKGRAKISIAKNQVKSKKNELVISIKAEDLASLHAAVGSQLRALKVIKGVQNFAEE